MKILLAPDSFKESMTAIEACEAMEVGVRRVNKHYECIHMPMADGGEGTVSSIIHATGGQIYSTEVIGPLGESVCAEYGILGDRKTAVIEMASASGLHLVPIHQRNPMITTTYGVGQLIHACLDKQVEKIIIGVGGSATNDGGVGAIQALGGKFTDKDGDELRFGGGELGKLHRIDHSYIDPRIDDVTIEIASDVRNPLFGANGAAAIFGRQKGATDEMIHQLDTNLRHYSSIIEQVFGRSMATIPGLGAAGGLSAGLMFFLNGQIKSGIDVVMEYTNLEKQIQLADIVFTGEGKIDSQTAYGKTPYGVSRLAKKYNKPVIAFAGKMGGNIDSLYDTIDAVFSISNGSEALEETLSKGKVNLETTTENVVRLLTNITMLEKRKYKI